MELTVKLTGHEKAVANLKAIDAAILDIIMDSLEESGEEMAQAMNQADRLNVAHSTFTSHRRKKTVGVGPSRAGKRAAITRWHEFGTAHHGATPIMRKVSDSWNANVKAKVTKRLKAEIDKRKS
jgi:hypothetical protein